MPRSPARRRTRKQPEPHSRRKSDRNCRRSRSPPPSPRTVPAARPRSAPIAAERGAGPRPRGGRSRKRRRRRLRPIAGRAHRHRRRLRQLTSVATKTNTPLINIPQSVNVVTQEFIQDQSFQSLTDVTRYVPGVAIHQGEGNRDELVIRGVDSSANFFVNGFRDDVQYLPRSLQRPEHRGPERTERADLRPRRRRRPRQPHAQGSRRHARL